MPDRPVAIEGDRPFVWINGEFKPKSQATVSVFDHGLLYGDGVFEGIRFYNKRIFKSGAHLRRIYRNCERIRLPVGYEPREVEDAMREAIEMNGLADGYIRLLITRGVGSLGLHPFRCERAGVIIIADKISLYPPEMYEKGMKVIVAKRPRTPTACLDPSLKSLNYLNNILAKIEAIDAGVLECIMLSTEGWVGECSGDNLFIVKDGRVLTPPLEAGMLDGITRAFVMNELCPKLGLEMEEKWMRIDEVRDADEVFLTGTAAEVIAVTSIEDTVIGDGVEGPVTRRIREAFREVIAAGAPED